MENNTKKSKGIPFLGVIALILAGIVGWLISDNNSLRKSNATQKEKIENLERNQKTDTYHEVGKCAGC